MLGSTASPLTIKTAYGDNNDTYVIKLAKVSEVKNSTIQLNLKFVSQLSSTLQGFYRVAYDDSDSDTRKYVLFRYFVFFTRYFLWLMISVGKIDIWKKRDIHFSSCWCFFLPRSFVFMVFLTRSSDGWQARNSVRLMHGVRSPVLIAQIKRLNSKSA